MTLDVHEALVWSIRLAAIGLLVSSVEYLVSPAVLRDDGLASWQVSRLRTPTLVLGPTGAILGRALSYNGVLLLLALRAGVALALIVLPSAWILNPWLVSCASVLCLLFFLRSRYGHDGADQMTTVCMTAMAMATLVGTRPAFAAAMWFVAVQSCLSYTTAGFAKARSAGWWNGTYLVGILNTRVYGSRGLAAFLAARPSVARLVARGVILWECSFPLVLVAPWPAPLAFAASGIAFHGVNAYVMGLNNFVWAFVATYPAILYCARVGGV